MTDEAKDDSPLTDELIEFAANQSPRLISDHAIEQWRAYIKHHIPAVHESKTSAFEQIFRLAKIGNRRLRRVKQAGYAILAIRLRKIADELESNRGT